MPDRRWLFVAVLVVVAVVVAAMLGFSRLTTRSTSAEPLDTPHRPTQPTHEQAIASATPPTLHPRRSPVVSSSTAPVFTSVPFALRDTARGFAMAWLSYDTRHEGRRAVLHRIAAMVTVTLYDRLKVSPRTHLPWQVLRKRHERAEFNVVGVSTRRTSHRHQAVVVTVNGILTVTSDLATLRMPTSLHLKLTRTPAGWRIANVHGGGA